MNFHCRYENIPFFDISFIVSPVIPFIWGIHKLHAWSLLQIGWLIFASANVHKQQCFCERGIWTIYTDSLMRVWLRRASCPERDAAIRKIKVSPFLCAMKKHCRLKAVGEDNFAQPRCVMRCIISDCKVDQHLH